VDNWKLAEFFIFPFFVGFNDAGHSFNAYILHSL